MGRLRGYLWIVLAGVVGCGDDGATAPRAPDTNVSCQVGDRVAADGTCLPPGTQDNGCPAGEVLRETGAGCRPGGLPPALCEDGDGADATCVPVVPAEPCTGGTMAVLGQPQCQPIGACGSGTWGDIPVDGSTQYVDGAYAGGDSDGTATRPWTTIGAAVAAADAGAIVAIAAGSYVEAVIVADKAVRLWGRCPTEVEVVGPAANMSAVALRAGADGSEVRGLAIRGPGVGLRVVGATQVLAEQLWVHDAGDMAVAVGAASATSELTVRASLIERAGSAGVVSIGGSLRMEGAQVRDTLPVTQGTAAGVLLIFDQNFQHHASATVDASIVEANPGYGLLVIGGTLTLDRSLVRDTAPTTAGNGGIGLMVEDHPDDPERSGTFVTSSILERSHQAGLGIRGGDASVEASAIRDVWAPPALLDSAQGILAEPDVVDAPSLTVLGTVVERATVRGVSVLGGQAWLEGVLVRDVTGQAAGTSPGPGVWLQHDPVELRPTSATVLACRIERTATVGLFVGASDATIEGTLVQDTMPLPQTLQWGRGVQAQGRPGAGSTMVLRDSQVVLSHDFGMVISDSLATLERVAVRNTQLRAYDGVFGDGLAGIPHSGEVVVDVIDSLFADNARAGMSAFGAAVGLAGTELRCNAIDLAIESKDGSQGTLTDHGGNTCGCTEPLGECKASSTGIAPPDPLPDG